MSFGQRLTLLVAGAVVLVGSTVVVSVYLVVREQLRSQAEQELIATAEVVRSATIAAGRLPVPQVRSPARPPNIPRIIDADGQVLQTRPAPLRLPVTSQARSVAAGTLDSSLETLRADGESFAVLTIPIELGRALQVAQSLAPVEAALRQLLRASLLSVGLVVLLAPLIGYAVAGAALVPVRRLSETASRIARTADLSERAGVQGDDELGSLAGSLNAMLDRLEETFDALERAQLAQRQLVADASHELQTPLTTLRANVELLALGSEALEADRDTITADTLAQIEDLTVLMGQLIDLAREDQREAERAPVRLDQVIEDVLIRSRQHHPGVSFAVDLEPTVVSGTPEALFRAIANLLDNAGKWSPDGSRVEVHLSEGTLTIRDHGPGIDDDDLSHVFQRFYRGGQSRSVPGSGLGLAIVERVVASHGGQISAEQPDGGGALFRVKLPTIDS